MPEHPACDQPKQMNILKLNTWISPATKIPDSQYGTADVKTITYKRGYYHNYKINGYEFFQACNPLKIKTLRINKKTWMVDDPPHVMAMENHATHYYGNVLVAGLGLGLIVHYLNKNENVKNITIIEKSHDVIKLIESHMPKEKLEIINEDFWNYINGKEQFDGIFYDLFVGDSRKLFDQALRVVNNLVNLKPESGVIRIHGFNNEFISQVANSIRQARKEFKSCQAESPSK